jgi:DNA-binding CsgD family transcriptional regulator
MSSIYNLYSNQIKKYHNKIKDICAPLQEHLDISYVSYQKVDSNGNYTILANRPDYLEYFFEERIYNFDPYLIDTSHYNNGLFRFMVIPELINKEDKGTVGVIVDKCQRNFNFYQSMLVTLKNNDYYETFCFATGDKNKNTIFRFANEINLFQQFISYFKTNTTAIINEIDELKINLKQIKGDDFFTEYKEIAQNRVNKPIYDSLFKQLAPREFQIYSKLEQLTPKEKQCLSYLLKGKTAYETSVILGVSKRTIETHHNNIKLKLGLDITKAEIAYLIGKYNFEEIFHD